MLGSAQGMGGIGGVGARQGCADAAGIARNAFHELAAAEGCIDVQVNQFFNRVVRVH